MVTLQANHQDWANATFGRRAAKEGEDPAKALGNRFQVQSILDNAGEAPRQGLGCQPFLYLVKANQLFAAGGTSLADAATKIKAPVLLITQPKDLVFTADAVDRTADTLKKGGVDVTHVPYPGLPRPSRRRHLDEAGRRRNPVVPGKVRDFNASEPSSWTSREAAQIRDPSSGDGAP